MLNPLDEIERNNDPLKVTAVRLHNEDSGDNEFRKLIVSFEVNGEWVPVIEEYWAGGMISHIIEESGIRKIAK